MNSISHHVDSFGKRKATLAALWKMGPKDDSGRLRKAIAGFRILTVAFLVLTATLLSVLAVAISRPYAEQIFQLIPLWCWIVFGFLALLPALGAHHCCNDISNAKCSALMTKMGIGLADGYMQPNFPTFELSPMLRLRLLLWLDTFQKTGDSLIQYVRSEAKHFNDEIDSQVFQVEKLTLAANPIFMLLIAALVGFTFGIVGNACYDFLKEFVRALCKCEPNQLLYFRNLFLVLLLVVVVIAELMWLLWMFADILPSRLQRLHSLKRALLVFSREGYVNAKVPK